MNQASSADEVARLRPPGREAAVNAADIRPGGALSRLHAGTPPPPDVLTRPRIEAVPEHCEALLRLLVARAPAHGEIAALVLRDPALLYGLLEAAPLAGQRLSSTLANEVTLRLETLGTELLRVWLLVRSWDGPPPGERARAAGARALLMAECALHLALETRYPYPDEAYLAGLWHLLGSDGCAHRPGDAAAAQCRCAPSFGRDEAALAAGLAARCGVPGPLADALAFHHALDEAHLGAHPLVRLVWAAECLAREDWRGNVHRVAAACGLSPEAVLSLRTDVSYLAAGHGAHAPRTSVALGAGAAASSAGAFALPPGDTGEAMRELVLAGLVRGAFAGLDEEALGPRLAMACRLLCAEAPPALVLAADGHDVLQALPLSPRAGLLECYAELGLRKDDETSVIALAARSATVTSWFSADGTVMRSARDWHVARWLGREGIVCLPLHLGDTNAVAVFGADEALRTVPAARTLLAELVATAATAALDMRRRQAATIDHVQRVEHRFREHARKIAHEASNPLTLVKGHLEMLARRAPQTIGASEELALLHGELERIGALLQRAGHPASEEAEPASCRVPELLHELRALYGEPLFGQRGIRFELRAAAVPPVAMPASALKQVLVNLFRNAAEALQPGGRFAVTVPGVVLSNGVPCAELRLIDNGPGLPPERQSDLAAPRPSAKGDEHQGLGLTIVHEILARWNVSCLCRSQAGTGTSYQLFVPLAKYP